MADNASWRSMRGSLRSPCLAWKLARCSRLPLTESPVAARHKIGRQKRRPSGNGLPGGGVAEPSRRDVEKRHFVRSGSQRVCQARRREACRCGSQGFCSIVVISPIIGDDTSSCPIQISPGGGRWRKPQLSLLRRRPSGGWALGNQQPIWLSHQPTAPYLEICEQTVLSAGHARMGKATKHTRPALELVHVQGRWRETSKLNREMNKTRARHGEQCRLIYMGWTAMRGEEANL